MCVEESQRSGSLKIKPATEANDRLVETVGGGSIRGDKPAWRLTVETRRFITLKAESGDPAAWLAEVAKRAADPEVNQLVLLQWGRLAFAIMEASGRRRCWG